MARSGRWTCLPADLRRLWPLLADERGEYEPANGVLHCRTTGYEHGIDTSGRSVGLAATKITVPE
jgi:hypothetical protein